jgi:hypothetical protein
LERDLLLDLLSSHHLRFPSRPLTRRAAFVASVDFFFDFIAELRVGVLFLGRHDINCLEGNE